MRAFLGLGSNIGDRLKYLREAVAGMREVVAVSGVYETEPVGGPSGQRPYLNCVVQLETSASPEELLGRAMAAERRAGRSRGARWGPRTLDVDVLLVGDLEVLTDELQLPHPRMWERGFVLVPLRDLAPELVEGKLGAVLDNGVRPAGSLFPANDTTAGP